MSSEPRKPNPNATIQLDALDPSELVDNLPPDMAAGAHPASRRTPPPLPAGMAPPVSAAPAPGPTAPRSPAKTIGTVLLFVVLVGAAVAGGLLVGRGAKTDVPVANAPASAPAPAPSRAPAASAAPLAIPTVEMKSP